jgi:hypothetical protein
MRRRLKTAPGVAPSGLPVKDPNGAVKFYPEAMSGYQRSVHAQRAGTKRDRQAILGQRRRDGGKAKIKGLPDFSTLKFTKYNQYESLVLPLVKWPPEHGVVCRALQRR